MPVTRTSRPDRTVRVLTWAVAIVILAVLTGFAYVAASGVLQPHSPRTAVENATLTLEQDLESAPEDPEVWADYIGVLTYAERFTEASAAVEDAYASVTASMTVPVQLAELGLLYAQGEHDRVLDLSDGVLADIDATVELERASLLDEDIDPAAIEDMSLGATERVTVYVLRAKVYRDLDQWDDVIAETTRALEQDPLAADIMTLRGIAYAASGDEAAARSDFEKALEFGHEPAAEELDKLER